MNQLDLTYKAQDNSESNQEDFARNLESHLKTPIHITFTNNRFNILTSKIEKNRFIIRIHKCFSKADNNVIKAISTFLTRKNKSASNIIGNYFDIFGPSEEEKKRRRKRKIFHQGNHFDLKYIMNDLNSKYFNGVIDANITWGNARPRATRRWKKSKHITLGQYRDEENLIIIHPNLDKTKVPKYVVEAIVYHEMCHQLIREDKINGRRRIHTRKFRDREKQYEYLEQAKLWEKENFGYLLRRP